MSKHEAIVHKIKIEQHPNPEVINLGVVKLDDYCCVVNKNQWKDGDLAVYIEPDTLVDTKLPQFSFLADKANEDGKYRVTTRKFKGVVSFGLLVPAENLNVNEGDDAFSLLNLAHYEPEIDTNGKAIHGDGEANPKIYLCKYDLENGRKYANKLFKPNDEVVVTEKIHGQHGRFVFSEKMYCGTRSFFRKKPNPIWGLLDLHPGIQRFCEAFPNHILHGEIYGQIQKGFPYGKKPGEIDFIAFDIMFEGKFLDYEDFKTKCETFDIPTVPLLYRGPYVFDDICKLAEGKTSMGDSHIKEGVVIKSVKEFVHPRFGRSSVKIIGAGYLGKDS